MCAASQRGSRCWRKTLARYGEAGPKRALCVEAGTKRQVISRTDSQNHAPALSAAATLRKAQRPIILPADVLIETVNILGKKSGHEVTLNAARQLLSPGS